MTPENIVLQTLSLGSRSVGVLANAAAPVTGQAMEPRAQPPLKPGSVACLPFDDGDPTMLPALGIVYDRRPASISSRSARHAGAHAARLTAEPDARAAQALPPVDTGRGAYIFLACGFALEFTMWGPVYAVGTLTNFYADYFPNSSEVTVSAVGTCMSCFAYVMCTVGISLFQRFRAHSRLISLAMLLVSVAALVGASFAHNIVTLILLQGVLNGIAMGLVFSPVMMFLPEWFNRRSGLAVGIIFSGNGLGGIVYPFLFQACLNNIGFRWTLRIWALINLTVAGAAVALIKPRLPAGSQRSVPASSGALHDSPTVGPACPRWHYRSLPASVQWFFTSAWQLNSMANMIGSAGYLPVSMYLTQYMRYAGMSTTVATGGLAILNASAFFGQLAVGWTVDRVDYGLTMAVIGGIGCVASLVLFGLSTDELAIIVVFAIIFGLTAGGLGATWGRSAGDVATISGTPSGTILPMFSAVKGISALAGPFISAALLQLGRKGMSTSMPDSDSSVSGSKPRPGTFGSFGFAPLVAWVGSCMAVLCATGVAIRVVRINKHIIDAGSVKQPR